MILFDTNVVSELVRPQPHPCVLAFARSCRPVDAYLPSVCEAELRYGCARLPRGRRRADLERNLARVLRQVFSDRVLPFDQTCAAAYATVRAGRELAGRPVQPIDALIGAMALTYGATLATRNVADFDGYGLSVVNPWQHA